MSCAPAPSSLEPSSWLPRPCSSWRPSPRDRWRSPAATRWRWRITTRPIRPAFRKNLANADQVKRGEYLARAADCMVCHTAPGGADFAGGLAIPLPFGTLYSTNITPDKDTGIGSYSDQEFLDALRRGKRRDGAHLYPAMPFTSYTYMTDADGLAIKAYLFSLPAVHATAPDNTFAFPFNQRWAMAVLVDAVQRRRPLRAQYRSQRGMEPRRLYRRSAGPLRRVPHAAESRLGARQRQKVRRRGDGGLARLRHYLRQRLRHRRLERRRGVRLSGNRARAGPRHGGGSHGRGRRPEFQPDGAIRYSRAGQLCAQRSAHRLARSAGDAGAAGTGFAEARRHDAGCARQKDFRRSPA